MFTDNDINLIKIRNICSSCIDEAFLKKLIKNQGILNKCTYCSKRSKSYSIVEFSELIETTFNEHYYRTSNEPTSFQCSMLADKESIYEWEREGEPVIYAIMNAAGIPENAASDIQKILEDKFYDFDGTAIGDESEFFSDSYYEETRTNDAGWQEKWRNFEYSLKTESRFFSQSASDLLESVFDGIDTMQTFDGRSLIVDAGPGKDISEVFRARSFQSDEKLKIALAQPELHLGSPPSAQAHAGRMNAQGISVFYGANNPLVALAEVRPPVGCQVTVARFEIIRPIRLLDLTALSSVTKNGSIFDVRYNDLLERTMFLRNLSSQITLPVMPDHETFKYLTTQAIADFLATKKELSLDGIIFPSVQAVGKALNFVFFHKAAQVEPIDRPKEMEVSVSLNQMYEEGIEVEYRVVEEITAMKRFPYSESTMNGEFDWIQSTFDTHLSTLKIDLDSIRIHIVDEVQFKTTKHSVYRRRFERENESIT